jgi:hypothetical protein
VAETRSSVLRMFTRSCLHRTFEWSSAQVNATRPHLPVGY